MNTQEIETILSRAPKMKAPAGLKKTLIEMAAESRPQVTRTVYRRPGFGSWLRNWIPLAAPALGSIICAVVLGVQGLELRELRESVKAVSANLPHDPGVGVSQSGPQGAATVEETAKQAAELERLRTVAAELKVEIGQLEKMQAENLKLRGQATGPMPADYTPEEAQAVAKARERAQSIQCINNLKQIGLAARIWANDHKEVSPPDIASMKQELGSPKVLICPGDSARQAAENWERFSAENVSYEYLAPSASDTEPFRVLTRCPVHGHIGLCDGSVQGQVVKNHPECLVERDGKLYFEPKASKSGGGARAQ